jgi:hypothetical protein
MTPTCRDFHIVVPADCVASNSEQDNQQALKLMETVLKVDTTPWAELNLYDLS